MAAIERFSAGFRLVTGDALNTMVDAINSIQGAAGQAPGAGAFTTLSASSGLSVTSTGVFTAGITVGSTGVFLGSATVASTLAVVGAFKDSNLTTPTTAGTVTAFGLSRLSTAVVTSTAFTLIMDDMLPGYKKRIISVGACTGWKIMLNSGAFVSTEGSTMMVLTFSGNGQFVDLEAITSGLIGVKGRSLAGLTISTST